MSGLTLLLAEDDADLRTTTRLVLMKHGFNVVAVGDGVEALEVLAKVPVDALVVDIVMPRMDGFTLLRTLRSSQAYADVPVILLTARDLPMDQVSGLDAGADDYVVKPFDSEVLAARVRSVVRRRHHSNDPQLERFGDLVFDRAGLTLTRAGHELALSATEFRLLETLIDHAGQALTREQLLRHVWGDADWGDPRVVDVNIQRLRAKIGAQHIETLRGTGYKWPRH